MPRHEDRTRIAVAGSKRGSWVGQGGRAAIAVSVVGLALLFATPIALADSGASGGQAAATGTTTTADPQGQTSGTPGGAQPSGSTSSQLVSGSGASSAPSQTSGSSSSNGQGTVADTSTPAASSNAPAASPSQTSDSSSSSGQGTVAGTPTPAASSDAPAASPSQTVSAATVPSTSSGATQSAAANATGSQSGAQNNSTTVRTGQGGNDGTVSQGNSDAATAASTAAGGTPPAGAASTSNATATATQTAPNNTSVDVRVGSPGNVGGANQSNGVQAAAGATANPPSGQAGGSGVANAQSTQTSPSNVSVVVRVASPGDNGAVTQQNTTAATAGANAPTPVSAGDVKPGPAGATNQTVPTTGEADGLNASTTGQLIDQRQGGDPPNAQASPTLSSGTGNPSAVGTATATQTGASNTSVSVRVGSPGKDGPVTQTNGATASGTSPQLSVVKTHCGTNTDVSVVIPGPASGPPGPDWQWNWTWDGTWTPPADVSASKVAPTSAAVWNWTWQNTPSASSTPAASTTATGSTPTGAFTWTWTWKQADGQTTARTWRRACDCNWTWNWTWDWSKGTPASTTAAPTSSGPSSAPQPAQTYDTGAVSQQNSVAANAIAGVDLATSQTVDQQPGIKGADLTQTLLSDQIAESDAFARALNTYNRNLGWGVATGTVTQSNTLEADAAALDHLDAIQVAIQRQTGSPTANQTMSAAQWTGNGQIAVAVAQSVQTDVGNLNVAWAPHANTAAVGAVEQRNSGVSLAISWNTASTLQWIQQFQNAGHATLQDEQAVNLLWNLQSAISHSLVAQAGLLNLNDLLVPAGSRAKNPTLTQRNIASSTTISLNDDATQQWISQTQNGEADNELSLASNRSVTIQTDAESMVASQVNLVNRAAWLGVEPPASPGAGGAGGTTSLVGGSSSSNSVVAASVTIEVVGATSGSAGASGKRKTTVHGPLQPNAPFGLPGYLPSPGSRSAGGVSAAGAVSSWVAPSARPTTSSGSRPPTVGRTRGSSEQPPGGQTPPDGSLGLGSTGPAPVTGGGLVALVTDVYRLAAPAHLGPHTPAPALGQPVTAADPFERPG